MISVIEVIFEHFKSLFAKSADEPGAIRRQSAVEDGWKPMGSDIPYVRV